MKLTKNQKIVIDTVRKKGMVAISDIVRLSSLSSATSSRTINQLLEMEFLIEEDISEGYQSIKGRPQRYVKWHGKKHYVIGIDVGTTKIKGALMNLAAEPVKEVDVIYTGQKNAQQVLATICDIAERLLTSSFIDEEKILGIGIAFAGMINKSSGIIKFSPAFDWYNIDAAGFFKEKFNKPIYFDNVTRLMALSETFWGMGKKYDNFAFINLGYGIGASIVNNSIAIVGQNGYAGEMGHTIAEPDGKYICSCGQVGCLTTTSSGEFIAIRAKDRIKKGEESILSGMCNNIIENIDAKMVFEAAQKNDPLSYSVVDYALSHLAYKIIDLKRYFDPQAFVLGGGLTKNGDFLFESLKKKLISLSMKCYKGDLIDIVPPSFPGSAAMIGAGALVAKHTINL
jgi:predicted NBD/HSP70 family sugar kinase